MTATGNDEQQRNNYSAKVTGRHAITLPAELCRRLHIEVGDTVELALEGDRATLKRTPSPPAPAARGLLRGYFSSWEDVNRYVAEERREWDEREKDLMEQHRTINRPGSYSPNSSENPEDPNEQSRSTLQH